MLLESQIEIDNQMSKVEEILESFLDQYTGIEGVVLESLETELQFKFGQNIDLIQKYRELTILSVDENFQTLFSFIHADQGTVIIFFLDETTYLSVFTKDAKPNKELAKRMYNAYRDKLMKAITETAEA